VAGTWEGSLCLVMPKGESRSYHCLLEAPPWPGGKMDCLAASEQVVVTGSHDGALRVVRMDTPFTGLSDPMMQ
jgi:hypothetical protein